MKRIFEFSLENGGKVLIEEAAPVAADGIERVGRDDRLIEMARQSFESVIANLRPFASSISTSLQGIRDSVDELTVDFGVKLDGKVGLVVVSGGAEANLRVSMKWKKGQA